MGEATNHRMESAMQVAHHTSPYHEEAGPCARRNQNETNAVRAAQRS